jgi:hypothetical protein
MNIDDAVMLAPCPALRQPATLPGSHAAKISVLHTITGVIMGGADMMLYRLLARSDRDRFTSTVLSLLGPGPIGEQIRGLGVPLRSLGMRQERPLSLAMLRLLPVARSIEPTLIQG